MVITNVRFDWLFIWEARAAQEGGPKKFSACCLIPKEDKKQVKEIEKAIENAKQQGIAKGMYTEAQTKAKDFRMCLRDGDEEVAAEQRPAHYKGHYFFNCSSDAQPGIIGPDGKPILNPDSFYSGCYGHVDVNFYPFNKKGGKGVAAGLNNIMKAQDGDRLDGRQKAEDAFADLMPQSDDDLQ